MKKAKTRGRFLEAAEARWLVWWRSPGELAGLGKPRQQDRNPLQMVRRILFTLQHRGQHDPPGEGSRHAADPTLAIRSHSA